MNWLKRFFRMLFRREDPETALDREIAFRIETLTEANLAQGFKPAEARRQALIEFECDAQPGQRLPGHRSEPVGQSVPRTGRRTENGSHARWPRCTQECASRG